MTRLRPAAGPAAVAFLSCAAWFSFLPSASLERKATNVSFNLLLSASSSLSCEVAPAGDLFAMAPVAINRVDHHALLLGEGGDVAQVNLLVLIDRLVSTNENQSQSVFRIGPFLIDQGVATDAGDIFFAAENRQT